MASFVGRLTNGIFLFSVLICFQPNHRPISSNLRLGVMHEMPHILTGFLDFILRVRMPALRHCLSSGRYMGYRSALSFHRFSEVYIRSCVKDPILKDLFLSSVAIKTFQRLFNDHPKISDSLYILAFESAEVFSAYHVWNNDAENACWLQYRLRSRSLSQSGAISHDNCLRSCCLLAFCFQKSRKTSATLG